MIKQTITEICSQLYNLLIFILPFKKPNFIMKRKVIQFIYFVLFLLAMQNNCNLNKKKSQHGCVRWPLCEHLTSPCHGFICGGLRGRGIKNYFLTNFSILQLISTNLRVRRPFSILMRSVTQWPPYATVFRFLLTKTKTTGPP